MPIDCPSRTERRIAEIENEVMNVDVGFLVRQTIIARYGGDRRLVAIVEIDGRLGGRSRGHRLAAGADMCAVDQRLYVRIDRLVAFSRRYLLLKGQLAP